MSQNSLEREIRIVLGSLAELEGRARQPAADKEELLTESLEELRTTVEQLLVAEDELRAEREELRAAQTDLTLEREHFRELFELAPYCELVTNKRGTIRAANLAAASLINVPAAFLVGKPLVTFIPLDERRRFRAEFGRAAALVEGIDWETRLQPRHGEPADVEISVSPLRDSRGQLDGFRWMIRDIGARKLAEAEARALRAELERRVEERTAALEVANRQAREAIEARDNLMSAVSHDLKNPLTIRKGYSRMLRQLAERDQAPDAERLRGYLDRIEAAVARLTAQVDELVDVVSSGQTEAPTLHRKQVDLVALVRRALAEYEQTGTAHRFRFESAAPSLLCDADPARLARVLDNLLSNAVKFSPDGGNIFVRVLSEEDERGRRGVVVIRDQGVGIPAADLPRIFDLFHRAGNVAESVPGTGIGLASARQIVELHGGTIDVDSQVDVGTTFTVRIPTGG